LGVGGDAPARVKSKAVGAFGGCVLIGEKKNNDGSYLVTFMKLEAKKRGLPWALHVSLSVLVLPIFSASSD